MTENICQSSLNNEDLENLKLLINCNSSTVNKKEITWELRIPQYKRLDDELSQELNKLKSTIKSDMQAKCIDYKAQNNELQITSKEVNFELKIPSYNKLDQELNKELENLKTKIKSIEMVSYENKAGCSSNLKGNGDVEKKRTKWERELKWRSNLQSLLEEKLVICNEMQKLKNVEEILKTKIKLKERSDKIVTDLKVDHEMSESDRDTVMLYRRQWRNIITELDDLNTKYVNIEKNIRSIVDEEKIIFEDDKDLLKNAATLKSSLYDLQVKHVLNLTSIYRDEINIKDKFIHLLADMLNKFYRLLNNYGHVTKNMADSYRNVVHTAKEMGMSLHLNQRNTISNEEDQNSDDGGHTTKFLCITES